MQRSVPAPVVALVLFIAFCVVGYFIWKANQPRFPAGPSTRADAMRKRWKTDTAWREAMQKAHPGIKGP